MFGEKPTKWVGIEDIQENDGSREMIHQTCGLYELPQPASHVGKPLSALHSLDFLVCISFSSSYRDPLILYAPKFPNLDSKSNNNDLHFYLY